METLERLKEALSRMKHGKHDQSTHGRKRGGGGGGRGGSGGSASSSRLDETGQSGMTKREEIQVAQALGLDYEDDDAVNDYIGEQMGLQEPKPAAPKPILKKPTEPINPKNNPASEQAKSDVSDLRSDLAKQERERAKLLRKISDRRRSGKDSSALDAQYDEFDKRYMDTRYGIRDKINEITDTAWLRETSRDNYFRMTRNTDDSARAVARFVHEAARDRLRELTGNE